MLLSGLNVDYVPGEYINIVGSWKFGSRQRKDSGAKRSRFGSHQHKDTVDVNKLLREKSRGTRTGCCGTPALRR